LSIVLVVVGVGRLELARRIDFSRPVLEIQRSLAALQKWEAWSFHAIWVGCWLLMMAFMIAFWIAMTGTRFWAHLSSYVIVNMLVSTVLGLAPLLLHVWSRRHNGKFAARMDAFLTSHSIARARAAIDEIDEFARG
jgi:hypothetical protein